MHAALVGGHNCDDTTVAGIPPIVALGVVAVTDGVLAEAVAPVAGRLVTAPSPVAMIWILDPGEAGLLELFWDPLEEKMSPWPTPFEVVVVVKIAGAKGAS